METMQRWQMVLDFSADFPMIRGGIYLRMILESWRQLTQYHPHVICSPLHIRSDGVVAYIESDSVSEAAAAVDTFRHKSTEQIRRMSGKRDAVLWEYVQFQRVDAHISRQCYN